jgi:hypothetical protein
VLHNTYLCSRKKSNPNKELRAALLHNTSLKIRQKRRGELRPQFRLTDAYADPTGAFHA